MIRISKPLRFVPGMVRGLQQSALHGVIRISNFSAIDLPALEKDANELFTDIEHSTREQKDEQWLGESILLWTLSLFRALHVVSSLKISMVKAGNTSTDHHEFEFFMPFAVHQDLASNCLEWFADFVALHSSATTNAGSDRKELLAKLEPLITQIEQFRAPSAYRFAIVKAAFKADIPVFPVQLDLYRLGEGARSTLVSGSLTEGSAAVGVRLANNKYFATNYLRTCGLPVPTHGMVKTAQGASELAEKLGYPVVIKPADQDEGRGVYANLATAEEVKSAFEKTAKISEHILVEKHCPGNTHRITVLQDKILKVNRRFPGGVTGDDEHTIEQLIEQAQASRKHWLVSRRQGKAALSLDEEAISMLAAEGLDSSSVLEKGRFVALRKRDNASAGGTTEFIPLEKVHEDNQRLAIDTASLLRMELAGIDLIMADISRSWMEQEAVICEVNSQPTVGPSGNPEIYQQILNGLLPDGHRIPAHLVIVPPEEQLSDEEITQMARSLDCDSWSYRSKIFVNREKFSDRAENSLHASRALLLNTEVKAALCLFDSKEVTLFGLPTDRFKSVRILGGMPESGEARQELQAAISLLPPGHDGIREE